MVKYISFATGTALKLALTLKNSKLIWLNTVTRKKVRNIGPQYFLKTKSESLIWMTGICPNKNVYLVQDNE